MATIGLELTLSPMSMLLVPHKASSALIMDVSHRKNATISFLEQIQHQKGLPLGNVDILRVASEAVNPSLAGCFAYPAICEGRTTPYVAAVQLARVTHKCSHVCVLISMSFISWLLVAKRILLEKEILLELVWTFLSQS